MSQTPAKNRPKIDDVAREAGVSRGTVSRVHNGGHWVSPPALAAVNAAIKKTGYRVNPHEQRRATEFLTASHVDGVLLVSSHATRKGIISGIVGANIPEDVAVAGFDDIKVSSTTVPTLTTVRQPFERISAEMVRLLLAVIDGERPAAITIPTELVVRESA